MAFSCVFKLNNGALNPTDEVLFIEFIDSAFDKYQPRPIKIARIKFNGQDAFISSNCPCYVSSKCKIEAGQRLDSETKIGYFSAEGEDIPYSKPYAIIISR
jgi:hypothetical protein